MRPIEQLKTNNNIEKTNQTWMQAFVYFHKGLLKMGWGVLLWLGLLVLVNAVVPLLFLPRLEALVSIGTFVVSFTLMIAITKHSGFTRLLGIGHFPWFALIVFLGLRIDLLADGEQLYFFWIVVLIGLNSISLLIDVVDVIRFWAGDREEIIQGL